jgi:LysR family transcriptional regulator, transcriptional activator of nhaA
VRRLLDSALRLPEGVRLVCHEDSHDRLLADLALHSLDVVISDAPVPTGSSVRAFNHLLGETGVSFFATQELARGLSRGFPESLDGAPFLLPLEQLTLRRALNHWFDQKGIHPRIVAEFEDSALLKVFGSDGLGVFVAPTVVEKQVKKQYSVVVVGRTEEMRERYYAISVERRLKHPAVLAITNGARQVLFGVPRSRKALT